MQYTVQQLASLAGVSPRTLHYYDETGILPPAGIKKNGYRYYGEKELLRLQQILFYRELEFSIDEIRRILSAPDFDIRKAFRDHRHLIKMKRDRLERLIKTIDKTLKKLNKETKMEDKQLYDDFSEKEIDEYAEEAKQRWGNTLAYKQSQERYGKLTKAEKLELKVNADLWMKKIAGMMDYDPGSEEIQEMIDGHYNALRTFYDPSIEMYEGLADMYIADSRFTAYYENYATGLAKFMHDAMKFYTAARK